jgi:hypothetical protein
LSVAEIKNGVSYNKNLPNVFMARVLTITGKFSLSLFITVYYMMTSVAHDTYYVARDMETDGSDII